MTTTPSPEDIEDLREVIERQAAIIRRQERTIEGYERYPAEHSLDRDAQAEALREAAADTNCADDYHLLIDRAARLAAEHEQCGECGQMETVSYCVQCAEFHPDIECEDAGCDHDCEAYMRLRAARLAESEDR